LGLGEGSYREFSDEVPKRETGGAQQPLLKAEQEKRDGIEGERDLLYF